MANAGYTGKMQVSLSDANYNDVDGISSAEFNATAEELETSDFKDQDGAKHRITGLLDGEITIDGDYEPADTNGQVLIRAAFFSRATVYAQRLPDGTNGYKVTTKVTGFKVGGEVNGKAQFSATLRFTGVPSLVSG